MHQKVEFWRYFFSFNHSILTWWSSKAKRWVWCGASPSQLLSHCPSPKTRRGAGNYHICGLEQRQGAHSLTTTPEKQTSLGKTYLLPIPIEVGSEIQRHKEPLFSGTSFPNPISLYSQLVHPSQNPFLPTVAEE